MKNVAQSQSSSGPHSFGPGLALLDPFAEHVVDTLNAPEVAQVVGELNRLLASHHFHSSKRCQAFLRYVVAETLAGRQELKERTIGIEVFDRSPSYDTNQDPVVRMTAGEVRKRLALSYQEISGPSGLRIELPVGSYIPRFQFFSSNLIQQGPSPDGQSDLAGRDSDFSLSSSLSVRPAPQSAFPPAPSEDVAGDALPPASQPRAATRLLKSSGLALLLVLICGAGFTIWRLHRDVAPHPTPIQELWAPLLSSADPILISIGQIHPNYAEVEPNETRSSIQGPIDLNNKSGYSHKIAVTVLGDSIAMADIASLLSGNGKRVTIRAQSATSFPELQQGPVVLIGAFDNDWTMILTDPLRFHFSIDPSKRVTWISDREHPEAKIGPIDLGGPAFSMTSDYAVVGRIYDSRTKQTAFIAAGLTPYGTQAAGEFLTDPASIAEIARHAPRDWTAKNMEILIRTDLIDNEPGPPVIVKSTFW